MTYACTECSEWVHSKRWALGYKTCRACGEKNARAAKHCIVPYHKGHYTVITNKSDLIGINNKTIR